MIDPVQSARRLGVDDAKIIPVDRVVVADWVRLKCQFGCGGYGECLTCPPYSPSPLETRRVLESYQRALLMRLDGQGGEEREAELRLKLHRAVADLERELFLAGYHNAWGMTAGPCPLCDTCDVTEACKYPSLARPSMEACGIDVFSTVRRADWDIGVVPTPDSPFSLFGLVLIE